MIEASYRWSNTMSLSHFEVLSEVLVSAPPIGPNHTKSLVSSNLMEIRVSNIVLLSVDWHSSISMWCTVLLVDFTESVSPMLDHSFLFYSDKLSD
jgi:hypothetical protein